MVAFRSMLLAAIAIVPMAMGRITKLYAPATVSAGTNITVKLGTEGYIQNWDDFSVVWGVQSASINCSECVGTFVQFTDLYARGNYSTSRSNLTVDDIPIPSGIAGDYRLIAAVTHLVGASGGTTIGYFKSNITIS